MNTIISNKAFRYSLSPSQQQCDNNYKQNKSYVASTLSSCAVTDTITTTATTTSVSPCIQQIVSSPPPLSPSILKQKNKTTITDGPSTNNQESTKWECSNCMYLNWSNLNRCTQCDSAKQQYQNVDAINNDVNDQMKSLNICGSDPDLQLAAIGQRNSPMGSATNLSGSRTNLGAGARISPVDPKGSCYSMHKWSCSVRL